MALLLTKSDKLSRNNLAKNTAVYKNTLLTQWEELPPFIVTSAETGTGKEEVLTFIDEAIKNFQATEGENN